jgi:hypothetical protein
VSNGEDIAVGHYDQLSSSQAKLMKNKKMLAGFALAAALSMMFWLAIIGSVYWMM